MEEGYIFLAENVLPTLLAISEEEQERGLMFQRAPTPIMSFIYSSPRINKFWMKNTPSALDILFCHAGRIVQIHRGEPFSTAIIGDDRVSDLVVELPFGYVEKMGIKIGNGVGLVSPTREQLKIILAKKSATII